jgi:uncharacterized protein YndB with AHSA1/START domain
VLCIWLDDAGRLGVVEEGRSMAKFTQTLGVSIAAPVEKVFAYLRDPLNAWGGYPKAAITEVKIAPEGLGTANRFRVTYLGITEKGTHEYTEFIPNRHIGVKSSLGPFFAWTFEPQEGGTRLTLHVEEEGNWALMAFDSLLEKRMRRNFETMLDAIKTAVEGAKD